MSDTETRPRRPMVAFLFPGQGSEVAGMGLELATSCVEARLFLEQASAEIGHDARTLLLRGDPLMRRTEVLQPLLAAVCLGSFVALERRGARPDVVAGHSLGELLAFGALGTFTHEAAIHIAAVRGASMAREAERRAGGMLALIGCDERGARDAVALGLEHGALDVAAHNAPDEWVVAGDEAALSVIASRYASRRLPVSGAWHGRTMAGAEAPLRDVLSAHVFRREPSATSGREPTGSVIGRERERLARIEVHGGSGSVASSRESPSTATAAATGTRSVEDLGHTRDLPRDLDLGRRAQIVSGCTGRAIRDPVDVPSFLSSQLTRTVRWADVTWTLAKMGVTDVVTVGPGRTLRGLVRKNGWSVRVHGTEDVADLSRTVANVLRAR